MNSTQADKNRKQVVFSGIQPSGVVHIGNYLGAIRNWARMLDQYDCIFCVVDYHAMTVPYDPEEMTRRIQETVMINIASGLDPERCRLFVQSHIADHTELCWILMTCTAMGDLTRMTQFKDKSKQHREHVNAGLFVYPVLMAADILLYKAEIVPIGDDQVQHLEFAREVCRSFNKRFGETFPEPGPLLSEVPRLMGLMGKAKMSKSLNNYISVIEEPEQIRAKLRTAATDPARVRRHDPGTPEKCNIFTMHKGFSPPDVVEQIAEGCMSGRIGCIECKDILADNMVRELTPVREKYLELKANRDYVNEVVRTASEECRQIAQATMEEVRSKVGVRWA